MKYQARTAFIVSNPQLAAEILNSKPARCHIFLVEERESKDPGITVCKGTSFHDTAIRICREMLQRRLYHIVTDEPNRPMQQKVMELIEGSCGFALSGAIHNALENLWLNLPFLPGSYSIDGLRGRFKGMPCIIAASGPSLQKNVAQLPALKGNAILISCGSALGPLQRRGITPHFEIVVDPNRAMYDTLKPHIDAQTCFLLSLMAHHGIAGACTGPRLFFPVNYDRAVLEDIQRVTGIHTVLRAMASVATTALLFALHADCDPIIFVGQDLCYPEDRTHIDGGAVPDTGYVIETAGGQRVRSSAALKEAYDFYAGFIPTLHDRTIINATEGGAGIPGAKHLSLAEAAEQYLQQPVAIPELPKLDTAAGTIERRMKQLQSSFQNMYVKTAGYQRKIQSQSGIRDAAAAGAKIVTWFDSLRAMPGYEYLGAYIDWALYRADMTEALEPKVELLAATADILRRQLPLLAGKP